MLKGAQILVNALEDAGVEVIFGIPGSFNLPLFDALYDSSIRVVTARHEGGAAFMADGYARATGRVGVCLTVTGPGITNAYTPLGEAYLDSSPILLISDRPMGMFGPERGGFHALRRPHEVMASVTGWSHCLSHAEEIPAIVAEALDHAIGGRPRPVYLEVPVEVQGQPASYEGLSLKPRRRPAADQADVERAATLLRESRRPLILAGGGVTIAAAGPALQQLAECLGAAVMTTIQGKGVMPDDHPLCLGDGWAASLVGAEFVSQADLTLAVGTRFGPLTSGHWQLPFPRPLIHADIDPTEVGAYYKTDVELVGDAKTVLGQLSEALGGLSPREPWLSPQAKAARLDGIRARVPEVAQMLDDLRTVLPPETICFHDLCGVSYWASGLFPVSQPRLFHTPLSFGPLGFALPASLGAKVALPNRPVVTFVGDGGFLFTVQELATAVQYRLPVVTVVFDDGGFGALKVDQDLHYGGRRIAVDLVNPDFVALAEAFGATGVRVDGLTGVASAVGSALDSDGPAVIVVSTEPILPPWLT